MGAALRDLVVGRRRPPHGRRARRHGRARRRGRGIPRRGRARGGRPRDRRGDRRSARSAAAYGGTWYRDPATTRSRPSRPRIRSGRRRAREGQPGDGPRGDRGGGGSVKQVLAAGVVGDAPRHPGRAGVHRLPAPERVRAADPRGGAGRAHVQAGHADAGRPRPARLRADLVRRLHEADDAGARGGRDDGRLRRDRLRRRLPEAHATAARWACPAAGRCCGLVGGGRRRSPWSPTTSTSRPTCTCRSSTRTSRSGRCTTSSSSWSLPAPPTPST